MLRLFEDLVEMRVEGLRHALVLNAVVVLATEVKHSLCSLVVEVKHLRVLSQGVKNDLADVNEEGNLGLELLLALDLLIVAVRH